MSVKSFDRFVNAKAARPELAVDWERQRATAREFCRRFAENSDTQMLGDQVGMGKTYVAMAVVAQAVLGQGGKALLVTPPSAVLRAKWEQEIRGFGSAYLDEGAGSLRPLVVRDYWSLISNLHDHTDKSVSKVSAETLSCILYSLWTWAVTKGWVSNRQNRWPQLNGFNWESGSALRFSSDYCIPAWEAFLEKENAERNDFLRRMLVANGRLWTHSSSSIDQVKVLFKQFAAQQDRFEPNVFILGMNAMRRPKSNSAETQRFAGFVLSELLRNKRQQTCERIIGVLQAKGSVISPKLEASQLAEMRQSNLYNLSKSVESALATDETLRKRWLLIERKADTAGQNKISAFFSDLLDAVVLRKLHESNIKLAVVDEVHNWKGSANGSTQFKATFAKAVPHKLLMTATPLQLGPEEMARIFGYAVTPDGPTSRVLDLIAGDDGLVSRCLDANNEFLKSLEALTSVEVEQLSSMDQHPIAELQSWMESSAQTQDVPPALAIFYRRACAYKISVDALLEQLGEIMIRHTKDQGHRSFHAGKEFNLEQKLLRNSIYATGGMWDERHELVNYMAMRLDQRLRAATLGDKQGETTRAHLVRGLTSSYSAYAASCEKSRQAGSGLPGPVLDYMKLFDSAISLSEHPKVAATVSHAVSNYRDGKKTLIFCERVSTVKEIKDAIDAEILSVSSMPAATEARNHLLDKRHLFVDVQLHRSWCAAHSRAGAWDEPELFEPARAFAELVLRREKAIPTARRVLRLFDLWFLRHEFRSGKSAGSAIEALVGIGDDLVQAVGSGGPQAAEVLASKSGEAEFDAAGFDLTVQEVRRAVIGGSTNLWTDGVSTDFDIAFWALLDNEALMLARGDLNGRAEHRVTFYRLVLDLQTGLRRVALRPDFVGRFAGGERDDLLDALHAAVRERGSTESVLQRIDRFLRSLARANGSINELDKTNTARRSLWRGVELNDDTMVQVLDGGVAADKRVRLCAAFNSPLAPDILVCTGIGSEGIDLHRECAEIIHHDLPWNPAKLEQRIGRIDRVGRLGEGSNGHVRVGIPFLAQSYEQFQYERVLSRARLFEVLLGKPDFDVDVNEEVYDEHERGGVRNPDADDPLPDANLPVLPEVLASWLRVDLSLAAFDARVKLGEARRR
ncbi:MAG: helicase-related protein [Pseudomonadota bacterium]